MTCVNHSQGAPRGGGSRSRPKKWQFWLPAFRESPNFEGAPTFEKAKLSQPNASRNLRKKPRTAVEHSCGRTGGDPLLATTNCFLSDSLRRSYTDIQCHTSLTSVSPSYIKIPALRALGKPDRLPSSKSFFLPLLLLLPYLQPNLQFAPRTAVPRDPWRHVRDSDRATLQQDLKPKLQ